MAKVTHATLVEMVAYDKLEPGVGERIEHTLGRGFSHLLGAHGCESSTADMCPYIEFEKTDCDRAGFASIFGGGV